MLRTGGIGVMIVLACLLTDSAVAAPPVRLRVEFVHIQQYEHVETWGETGSLPAFTAPWAIVVSGDSIVYVSWMGSLTVMCEPLADAEDGPTALFWDGTSTGDGRFLSPTGLAVGSGANLYVVDSFRARVYMFDRRSGQYLRALGAGSGVDFRIPRDVAYTPGFFERPRLWVTDFGAHCVHRNHPDRGWTRWGEYGDDDGEFNRPCGIACSPDGSFVYVVDRGNHRIQKFAEDGRYITQWGGRGDGPGQFSSPEGIAITRTGQVLVADTGNDRIQKFNPRGGFITQWGHSGDVGDEYGFSGPRDLAVGPDDRVYVTDFGNNAVKIYRSQ